MERYRQLFLDEAGQHLEALAAALERPPPYDTASIHTLFRHAHSIKGMAAAMGAGAVRDRAHLLEDILGRVRSGLETIDVDAQRTLLAGVDGLAADLEAYAATGAVTGDDAAPGTTTLPITDTADDEPPPTANEPPLADAATGGGRVLRLDGDAADRLHEQITDLALSAASLDAALGPTPSRQVADALDGLRRTVRALRTTSTALRVVRLSTIAPELARTAREVSSRLGKNVRFVVRGADTAIDRTVVEALSEPLLHLVRNAIDHGVEEAAARRLAGKPGEALIVLASQRRADTVDVTLEDDGAGLDVALLTQSARAAGHDISASSDPRHLATLPGVSCREEVTELSGRGVGLDLVRRRVEGLGGHLEIDSRRGAGTRVTLRVPLTLAMQRLFLVRVADRTFALSRANLRRVISLPAVALTHDGESTLCPIEGTLLEVIPLAETLELTGSDPREALVVEQGGREHFLVVDQVLAERELVVRPLGRPLQRLAAYSAAAALLPKGETALILDAAGLVELHQRRRRAIRRGTRRSAS